MNTIDILYDYNTKLTNEQRDDIAVKIKRLEKGLRDIKKHLRLIGCDEDSFSPTYRIATDALQEELNANR